jgi:hypothetical protein
MSTRFKELWLIDDPLDGMHIFKSKIKAMKQLKKWREEAYDDPNDSVYDMTGPYRFIRVDE